MRIAITGTHCVGKTSLAHALADALPGYVVIDEPYHEMVSEGHLFSHPPTTEDFEEQLEYSLRSFESIVSDAIFDRCPVDLLAYLLADPRADDDVLERHIEDVGRAMQSLDLVVLVPIESPDRVDCPDDAGLPYLRAAVDHELNGLLSGDRLVLGAEVMEVRGPLRDRVAAVLARVPRS